MSLLPDKVNIADWNRVSSSHDIESLMKIFGGFSDCIFFESLVWGECYVDSDLSIVYPPGAASDQKAKVVFHRQGAPSKIELLFVELKSISMRCRDSASDGIINFAAINEESNGNISFTAKSSSSSEAEVIFAGRAGSIFWRTL